MNSNEYIPATQPDGDDDDDDVSHPQSADQDLDAVDDVELAHVLGVPEEFIAKMSPSKSLPATPVQTMAPPEKVPEIAVENPDPTSMDRQRRIEILKYLMLI